MGLLRLNPEWKEIDGQKYYKFSSSFDRFKYHYGNLVMTLVFLILLFVSWNLISHIDAISKNPFIYGASEVKKSLNSNEISCACSVDDKSFGFNETAIWTDTKSIGKNIKLNLSEMYGS